MTNIINIKNLDDQSSESFWMSATNYDSSVMSKDSTWFYWDSTATLLADTGFEYWAANEPSNETGPRCGEFSASLDHFWADNQCEQTQLYVCEFRPCVPAKVSILPGVVSIFHEVFNAFLIIITVTFEHSWRH
jgi:hypothetical protein